MIEGKIIKVSIIMPLYNASKYLEEALNSIREQKLKEYELICIDDASTDSTMDIIMKYQAADERIRIMKNDIRSGAAISRNKGMEMARGEYLTFLDGDDVFDENMLEEAYWAAHQKNADVVAYEFQTVTSDRIHDKQYRSHSEKFVERYCKDTFSLRDCEPYEILKWGTAPWNKIYRNDFIKQNHLEFQSLSCCNDVYFVFMSMILTNRMLALEDGRVMVYVRNHTEMDRISSNRDPKCSYYAFMKIKEELMKRKIYSNICRSFYYQVFACLRYELVSAKKTESAQMFYDFICKEGLDRLCIKDSQYEDWQDAYCKGGFEEFLHADFQTGWYKNTNILSVYLNNKKEDIINLFSAYKDNGRAIAIWGAGENGRCLLWFCEKYHIEVGTVIDAATEKQGRELLNHKIISPNRLPEEIQVIIVSAYGIYENVKKGIKNRNIEVIDMNEYVRLI